MVILLLWYFVKYHKRWYSGKKFFLFITIHVQKEIFFSGNYKNVHIYIVSYNSNKQQTLNPFFQLNEEAHIRYREKYFFSFRLKIGSRPQMFSSKMYSFDFEVKKIYIFVGGGGGPVNIGGGLGKVGQDDWLFNLFFKNKSLVHS